MLYIPLFGCSLGLVLLFRVMYYDFTLHWLCNIFITCKLRKLVWIHLGLYIHATHCVYYNISFAFVICGKCILAELYSSFPCIGDLSFL